MSADLKPQRQIPLRDTRPVADKPSPAQKLVVVKASYGVVGDAKRSRDVRERLQKSIDAGERLLAVQRLADGDDPAFGVVKGLVAECTADGKSITIKGDDTQTVILSANPSPQEQQELRAAAGRHAIVSPVTANPFDGTCEIPADLDLAKSRVFLEMDDLTPEAAASITVNGQFAGGFIGKPFRLDVTRLLKPGSNAFRVEPFAPKSARLVIY